ncbi:MAG: hypothetical protein R3B07_37270 [Polyangiaceae bacterium]
MSEPESNLVTRRGDELAESEPATSSSVHVSVELEEPIPETPRSVATPTSDRTTTLLSAPTPASTFEVETEDRLARLERELSFLRSRLESVEAQSRLAEDNRRHGSSADSGEPSIEAKFGPKQWRVVAIWILGLGLLAAYGLLK